MILQNKLRNNKKNLIEKKHKIKWWQNISDTFAFKNFMAPFYGWGSPASRLEPLQGGSLLFTTKFPEIPGTLFYRPRKDEKLSRPWSNPVVLNTGPLDWESSWIGNHWCKLNLLQIFKTLFLKNISGGLNTVHHLKWATVNSNSNLMFLTFFKGCVSIILWFFLS